MPLVLGVLVRDLEFRALGFEGFGGCTVWGVGDLSFRDVGFFWLQSLAASHRLSP